MLRSADRVVDHGCPGCDGVVSILNPCADCSGTGILKRRCRSCFTWKLISEYLVGGELRRECSECRKRVRTKVHGTPAGIAQDGPLLVKFTRVSRNRKTGAIPVAMTPASTCPPVCPWKGAGCYAEQHYVAIHWRRLSAGHGITWEAFCGEVAALPAGQLWRMGEAGDLPGRGNEIDGDLLYFLVLANLGRRGFAYTHKPVLGSGGLPTSNRLNVLTAVRGGFAVNLSADSLEHADQLSEINIAPVTVVLPSGQSRPCRTPAGRHVVVCPAIANEGVTCESCELCAKADRKAIVGFPAHGDSRRKMTERLVQLKLFQG